MMGSMMRRAMLGDGSTLNLDFTQMSTLADLTSRGLTFSRSTSGTYINASGLVATATAGNPRFDYDTSGNSRGILIEGSATNLVYHSETFRLTAVAAEPYWADSASISRGSDTAPDGTAGAAVNFVAIGTAGTVIQTAAVGSSANRTFSFWARRSGGGTVEYTLDNGTTWTAVTITASWVRYTATATNANQRVGFRVATGAGTSIWGAQLEAGSGSSSYISTGASTGSRAADKMSMNDITSMNWNQTAGTFLLDMDVAAETNQSSFPGWFGMYTATPVRVVRCLLNNSSGTTPRLFIDAWSSTPTQILNFNIARPAAPTRTKFAFALSNSGQAISASINGGTIGTGTGTGIMQTPTRMLFHQDPSAGDNELFPVHMKALKYWPTNLPNAQLQAITT